MAIRLTGGTIGGRFVVARLHISRAASSMTTRELTDSQKAMRVLAGAMLAGILCVVLYSVQVGDRNTFPAIVSVGVLLAGGSALVGGTLGFLFGIPRTLQQDGVGAGNDSQSATPETQSSARRIDYRVNTNLEQISDWLTKILVGVGLTQISEIRSGVGALSTFAAQGLGDQPFSQVFASALLSYFAILGFLFGYLWTRLFLAGALRQADQTAIGALAVEVQKVTKKAEITERKLEDLKKQSEQDVAALNLAYRQLNPTPDLPHVTQDALNSAVAAASQPIKVQIFNRAWEARSENWRHDKEKMERTIPVFQSLIHCDVENRYHMNHGQLGFALKDKREPDWLGAERELSTAIELRGKWDEQGWLFYELNRAVSRIMLDQGFPRDQPTAKADVAPILEDLKAAAQADDIKPIVKADPVIQKWMSLNNIKDKDLRT